MRAPQPGDRLFAAALAAAGLLALQACAGSGGAGSGIAFSASDDRALVVLGLTDFVKHDGPTTGRKQVDLHMGRTRKATKIVVTWQRYDPETDMLAERIDENLIVLEADVCEPVESDPCRPVTAGFLAPPGSYVLTDIEAAVNLYDFGIHQITRLKNRLILAGEQTAETVELSSRVAQKIRGWRNSNAPIGDRPTLRFTVAAGQARYVGHVPIRVAFGNQVVTAVERLDEDVARFRAANPEIAAPLDRTPATVHRAAGSRQTP